MRIGELLQSSGITRERFKTWHRNGNLPFSDWPVAGEDHGWRTFKEEHVHRLVLMRRLTDGGFMAGAAKRLIEDDFARAMHIAILL